MKNLLAFAAILATIEAQTLVRPEQLHRRDQLPPVQGAANWSQFQCVPAAPDCLKGINPDGLAFYAYDDDAVRLRSTLLSPFQVLGFLAWWNGTTPPQPP